MKRIQIKLLNIHRFYRVKFIKIIKGEIKMYCLTRYEMKFNMNGNEIVVPARTKCEVVLKPKTDTVNAEGVQLGIIIDNYDIGARQFITNENKVIKYGRNINNSSLEGVYVYTNTSSVYMDANDKLYYNSGLYKWQLEKIFGENKIPKYLIEDCTHDCMNGKYVKLQDLIYYLEDEFTEWVNNNCEFREITQEDIEEDHVFDGFEVGDFTLSDLGIKQFE